MVPTYAIVNTEARLVGGLFVQSGPPRQITGWVGEFALLKGLPASEMELQCIARGIVRPVNDMQQNHRIPEQGRSLHHRNQQGGGIVTSQCQLH